MSLNNLGEAELALGHVDEARERIIQALKLSEQHFKKYGQLWTTALINLAEVRRRRGEFEECARLLRHGIKNRATEYGQHHDLMLDVLYRLGTVEADLKRDGEAVNLFKLVIAESRKLHGPKHLKLAQYLTALARMRRLRKEDQHAPPLLQEALEIARYNLDSTFAVLSERQQLAMTRDVQPMLSAYIDLALARQQPGEDAYRHVLGWKGAVLKRQQQLRLGTDQATLAPLLKLYQEASRQLATLALAAPTREQRAAVDAEVTRLSSEKERLEGILATRSNKFRKSQEAFTIEKLQKMVPSDAVLVDFMEYDDSSPTALRNGATPPRLLVAFIVRPNQSIAQVSLGDTESIYKLGEQWRAEIMAGKGGIDRGLKLVARQDASTGTPVVPQIELRRRLWEPMEPYIKDAKLVLWSPDGGTAKLPLAALPGRDPDKYLIEEVALVVVPSPSQLRALTDAPAEPTADDMSLLVVGDVDFGASPGSDKAPDTVATTVAQRSVAQTSAARFANLTFTPLPGTGVEAKAIAEVFHHQFAKGKLTRLLQGEATESQLRAASPGHRYLHLATHGFFAPELAVKPNSTVSADLAAQITDLHPGLLSGIALSGANPGSVKPNLERPDTVPDDGVMTALEVASLDLGQVELAILSACETGLGQSEGGEGLLGLQRAFQVAGAKATVASLWKVDDSATQVLMTEFYQNMWNRKLGKLEALREAQLAMLNQYDARQQKLVSRGLKLVNPKPESKEPARLAPYYWAAFMLSGDWR